jgi:hypothetical protein
MASTYTKLCNSGSTKQWPKSAFLWQCQHKNKGQKVHFCDSAKTKTMAKKCIFVAVPKQKQWPKSAFLWQCQKQKQGAKSAFLWQCQNKNNGQKVHFCGSAKTKTMAKNAFWWQCQNKNKGQKVGQSNAECMTFLENYIPHFLAAFPNNLSDS